MKRFWKASDRWGDRVRVFSVIIFMLLFFACDGPKDSGSDSLPPPQKGEGKVTAKKSIKAIVYSYVDKHGHIRMASDPTEIPMEYRDQVVVTNAGRSRQKRINTQKVLVLDLREDEDNGPVNYSVIDLDAITRRAPIFKPQNPGEMGKWVVQVAAHKIKASLGLTPATVSGAVVLYSAPWCGYCKKAAAHLRSRGVDFLEYNIDEDRRAASDLSRKLNAAGMSGSGIPVLDIDGTIVVGFNKKKIDQLLNQR